MRKTQQLVSLSFGIMASISLLSAFYILLAQPYNKAVLNDKLFAGLFAEACCFIGLFLYTQRLINGSVKAAKTKQHTGKVLAACMLFIALSCFTNTFAQNARISSDGNYVALKVDLSVQKATGKTFTDAKGIEYPVYESKNGKKYYIRTSKAGKEYKCYLKLESDK